MKIVDVKAYATSFRVPKERQVSLGIGTMTKRDCVMVKVTTEDGITGWGESHHARSPGSIGHLINTTLKGFVVGMDATDTTEDGNITILQPDLSKSGGITEVQRIAAAASMWKLPIHPHSSMTGLNHAVSIHFLASLDNGGYFEAALSVANKFRDQLGPEPLKIPPGCCLPPLHQ